VFLYFNGAQPGDADAQKVAAVKEFRSQMMRDGVFIGDFADTQAFEERISRDLRIWIDRWRGVPEICAYALRKTPGGAAPAYILGENRLAYLKQVFDPLSMPDLARTIGLVAMWMYQEGGPSAAVAPLKFNSLSLATNVIEGRFSASAEGFDQMVLAGVLRRESGARFLFANDEWFYFFCACGLLNSILREDVHAVERRPFINPIHQYLQALVIGHDREQAIATLRKWLVNQDGVTSGKPIARNFAAYALGMVNAVEAHEDLARMIDEDVGQDVRTYCVASLGRMRARVQLPTLVDLFKRTEDADLRLTTAQAVSRMVGIADYPL